MKAKEYYAKYKDRIASVDDKESLQGVCDIPRVLHGVEGNGRKAQGPNGLRRRRCSA